MNLEVKKMLEKGAISNVSNQEGEFLSHILLVGKMMGQQASNQSEKPQQICPLPAFKSGEFALPKTFITE